MTRDSDLFEHHLRSSERCGQPERWTHQAEAINPLCGDRVALWLEVREDRIETARFTSAGCAVSRAGASLLCERIAGRPLNEANSLTARELLDAAGIELSPTRRQCLLLGLQALRQFLAADGSDAAP